MEPDDPWKVFIPQQLKQAPASYLTGCVDGDNAFIYISGVVRSDGDLSDINVIGYWHNGDINTSTESHRTQRHTSCWVSVQTMSDQLSCRLLIASVPGAFFSNPVMCIEFDPSEFMKSLTLVKPAAVERHAMDKSTEDLESYDSIAHRLRSKTLQKHQSAVDEVRSSRTIKTDCVTLLSQTLGSMANETSSTSRVKLFYCPPKRSSGSRLKIPSFFIWAASLFEFVVKAGFQGFKLCCSPLPRILHIPSIIQYVQDKLVLWKTCYKMNQHERFNKFLFYNCCCQQLLDSCLGLAIIVLVSCYNIHQVAALFVLDWADGVAGQLSDLVQWLMGAPAGLKLNAQLTKFLGHFFIYHIYLWTGYLSMLRVVMPTLLWYCCLVGLLGLSAQLCLLRDLLSMLTLHIYCFYVYAAKIFSLQVYLLGSLWRLFRGKKWNVLRSRVDSAAYTTDQLFVGTLLFTVFLFLLPTTALYYSVFTLLRLAALTVQGFLAYIVDVVMAMPVFTLMARALQPKLVAGNIKFSMQQVLEEMDSLCLHMETCQTDISELVGLTGSFLRPAQQQHHTWPEFLSHLLCGKLVYPWVEPRDAGTADKKKD